MASEIVIFTWDTSLPRLFTSGTHSEPLSSENFFKIRIALVLRPVIHTSPLKQRPSCRKFLLTQAIRNSAQFISYGWLLVHAAYDIIHKNDWYKSQRRQFQCRWFISPAIVLFPASSFLRYPFRASRRGRAVHINKLSSIVLLRSTIYIVR